MPVIEWILIVFGHVAIACVMFNHVHAGASLRNSKKITEKIIFGFAILPAPLLLYMWLAPGSLATSEFNLPIWFYLIFAKVVGVFFLLRWAYRGVTNKLPDEVTLESSKYTDIQSQFNQSLLHGSKSKLLKMVPGNQVAKLRTQEWDFRFSNLPNALCGLKICQLSDLHFTGLVKKEYFERVVALANEGRPDLVVITGDIIDNDECLDWIEAVLSRLESKYGIYYVFGNHDQMVTDQKQYRQRLKDIGFISLADGGWHSIKIGDCDLLLAGNEIPWYQGAATLPGKPENQTSCFSILLSHSPDQIGWAIKRGFDLVFSGHTHGGQIRLPIVGPIIAPSRYGIKFAAGTFKVRGTLMHVSRGVSGDEPIRINCPPELGFFTLSRG